MPKIFGVTYMFSSVGALYEDIIIEHFLQSGKLQFFIQFYSLDDADSKSVVAELL